MTYTVHGTIRDPCLIVYSLFEAKLQRRRDKILRETNFNTITPFSLLFVLCIYGHSINLYTSVTVLLYKFWNLTRQLPILSESKKGINEFKSITTKIQFLIFTGVEDLVS